MPFGPPGSCAGGADQVTLSARAARIAAHSVCATTPRKLPFCTTRTMPGILAIDPSYTDVGRELTTGGRTTRPCSMPGTRTSCAYRNVAPTFDGRSKRATDV